MYDSRRAIFLCLILVLIALPITAHAETDFDWDGLDPITGTVDGGRLALDIGEAGTYPLLVIEDPTVGESFQVDGTVQHEGVDGVAYLEMWTVMEDGSRYFTRTLAEEGPLQYLTGTSAERDFALPFLIGEDGPVPVRLEINLVTEGSGKFWIGPLTLTSEVEQADASDNGLSWLWVVVVAGAVIGVAIVTWARFDNRRRAAEQRRMSALDSLGS